MAYNFSDLVDEVKRRATVNEAGTTFDTAIKNLINMALFRVSREALWRPLRRKASFDTKGTYTTGSGAGTFTNGSSSITVTGATFLTDGIEVGRRINLSGDSISHRIATITGETTLTIEKTYGGTTTSTGTYTILGQEEYNLPIQSSHRLFIWHEEHGFPFQLRYISDQEFYTTGFDDSMQGDPTHYRMWGEDMVIEQLREASVITVSSSATADTSKEITVFGTVSGYPDYEIITTDAGDGTTPVAGSKSFTSIERVVKGSSTTGRITATANSANTTVAVIPVGDTAAGLKYSKLQLYPLPKDAFKVKVQYYKDPYRLVNDGDVHELGHQFDEVIILLATQRLKAEQDQKEGEAFLKLYKDEIRSLKSTNADKIDWFVTLTRGNNRRSSQFAPHISYQQVGSNYGPSFRF